MDRSAGPDGCWPWQATRNARAGHGRIRIAGKLWLAHRWLYEKLHGPLPASVCVLHRCDNPPCVNPAHLWTGSVQDNNADRDAKGRNVNRRGSAHGMARLTEEKVEHIRRRHACGQSVSSLAREFSVARGTIRFVVNRETWTHV